MTWLHLCLLEVLTGEGGLGPERGTGPRPSPDAPSRTRGRRRIGRQRWLSSMGSVSPERAAGPGPSGPASGKSHPSEGSAADRHCAQSRSVLSDRLVIDCVAPWREREDRRPTRTTCQGSALCDRKGRGSKAVAIVPCAFRHHAESFSDSRIRKCSARLRGPQRRVRATRRRGGGSPDLKTKTQKPRARAWGWCEA